MDNVRAGTMRLCDATAYQEVDPLFSSLSVAAYEQQNSSLNFLLYLRTDVNNVCDDPADVRLRYITVQPRLNRRWFVTDFATQAGYSCSYGSPRNSWGWHFSGVKHRLYARFELATDAHPNILLK
jgi:hypothetical protein